MGIVAAAAGAASSHDVAVVDGKLYVLGGWNMGAARTAKIGSIKRPCLICKPAQPTWKEIQQPFQRRALIVSVHAGKIFVIGGFDEDNQPQRRVDVYDPVANQWSTAPELPGADHNGFAPAACTLGSDLYASVADGSLLRLDQPGKKWQDVTKLQPRIVHRLIPHGDEILVVGGGRRRESQLNRSRAGRRGKGRGQTSKGRSACERRSSPLTRQFVIDC